MTASLDPLAGQQPSVDQPVRRIPGDPLQDAPSPGIALCLSGGGYRAMLFHLGALWRLNELGYLHKLDRVSSVSGGSITAGVLAMNWSNLAFDAGGVSQAFREQVVCPVRKMGRTTIDVPAILLGILVDILSFGRRGSLTPMFYERSLFHGTTLQNLPDPLPRFVFNSTSLQSGVLWRFSKPYMADYRVGLIMKPDTRLAVAVGASSAFPPFISPVVLKPKESDFEPGSGKDLQRKPYTTRVVLTDGGVYDNLGLETAWKKYDTILISDACARGGPEESPAFNWLWQPYHVLMLINSQVTALRKRQAINSFVTNQRKGVYWGIGTDIANYKLGYTLPCPVQQTAALASFETRLRKTPARTQEALINWGYAVCDAGMRAYVDKTLPPPVDFPYPGVGVSLS